MKLQILVHQAEEGGYWAEVPSIPGCATQGDSLEELQENVCEAVAGCLSVDVQEVPISEADQISFNVQDFPKSEVDQIIEITV